MKKLYHEYFRIPEQGKLSERVVKSHLAVMALLIVVCLASMSLSAYAYYTHTVTSAGNTIQAATTWASSSVVDTQTGLAVMSVDEAAEAAADEGSVFLLRADGSEESNLPVASESDLPLASESDITSDEAESNESALFLLNSESDDEEELLDDGEESHQTVTQYVLPAGTTYEVTLTKEGTGSTCYCVVSIGDTVYYTGQIDDTYVFTVEVIGGGTVEMSILSSWGTPPGISTFGLRPVMNVIEEGGTIETVGDGEVAEEELVESTPTDLPVESTPAETPAEDGEAAASEVPAEGSEPVEGEEPIVDEEAAEGEATANEESAEGEVPVESAEAVVGETPVEEVASEDTPAVEDTPAEIPAE